MTISKINVDGQVYDIVDKSFEEKEEVISAALNDLDDRINDLDGKTVQKVQIGESTPINPVNGVATLPAYPTTLPASDVSAWAKESTKPTYTKSEVGLSNVTNDAQVKRSEMGVADGVATLDSTGKVPSSQLISYIVEGYFSDGKFYISSSDYVKIGNLWWAKGNIVPKAGGGYKIGNETDYGAYFSWGNIVPHFSSNGSSFDDGYQFDKTTYRSSPGGSLYGQNIASNDAAHNAALALLGGSAKIPTKEEFQELLDNTDTEWVTIDGVNGRKLMKKSDHSVYVFFPAAGDGSYTVLRARGSRGSYWSSSYWDNGYYSYNLSFSSYGISAGNSNERTYGLSVRAVSSVEPFSEVTPETGRLYIDTNTNKIYRWNGSVYVDLTNF